MIQLSGKNLGAILRRLKKGEDKFFWDKCAIEQRKYSD